MSSSMRGGVALIYSPFWIASKLAWHSSSSDRSVALWCLCGAYANCFAQCLRSHWGAQQRGASNDDDAEVDAGRAEPMPPCSFNQLRRRRKHNIQYIVLMNMYIYMYVYIYMSYTYVSVVYLLPMHMGFLCCAVDIWRCWLCCCCLSFIYERQFFLFVLIVASRWCTCTYVCTYMYATRCVPKYEMKTLLKSHSKRICTAHTEWSFERGVYANEDCILRIESLSITFTFILFNCVCVCLVCV